MTLPLFVRNFIIDFVENGLAVLFALNLAIPGSLEDVKAQAAIVGIAVIGALISAARRAVPGAILWLREKLDVPA